MLKAIRKKVTTNVEVEVSLTIQEVLDILKASDAFTTAVILNTVVDSEHFQESIETLMQTFPIEGHQLATNMAKVSQKMLGEDEQTKILKRIQEYYRAIDKGEYPNSRESLRVIESEILSCIEALNLYGEQDESN